MKPSTSASSTSISASSLYLCKSTYVNNSLPNPIDEPVISDSRFLDASIEASRKQSEKARREYQQRHGAIVAEGRETTAQLFHRYHEDEERKRQESNKNKDMYQVAATPVPKNQDRKRRMADMEEDWAKRTGMNSWMGQPTLPPTQFQLQPNAQQQQHAHQQAYHQQYLLIQQQQQQMALQQQHQQNQHMHLQHQLHNQNQNQNQNQPPSQQQQQNPQSTQPLLAQCLSMPSTSTAPAIPSENHLNQASPMTNAHAPLSLHNQNGMMPNGVVGDQLNFDNPTAQMTDDTPKVPQNGEDLVDFLAQSEFRIDLDKLNDLGPDCFDEYFRPFAASTSTAVEPAEVPVPVQNILSPVQGNGPQSHHSIASNPASINGSMNQNQPAREPSAENPLGAPMFSSTPVPPANQTPNQNANAFTDMFAEQAERDRERERAAMAHQQQQQHQQELQQQQQQQQQQQMAMHQQMMIQQQQQQQREMFMKAHSQQHQQHAQHQAGVTPPMYPGYPVPPTNPAQHAQYMQQMRFQQMRYHQGGMMDPRMDPRMMGGYGMGAGPQGYPTPNHPQLYHHTQTFAPPTN